MDRFVTACCTGVLAKHGLFTSHLWRFNALPESPMSRKRKAGVGTDSSYSAV